MLKRNIALLIAGGLLSAQVNLAAAYQGTFPPSADDLYGKMLPAQLKYLEEREAEIAKNPTVLRGDSFPPSADDLYGKMLPAQARYFEERTVTLQARTLDMSAPLSR